jgi:hypothetical protein
MAIEAQMALNVAQNRTGDAVCTACTCEAGGASAACDSPCLTDCEVAMAASVSGLPLVNIRNGQNWYCRTVAKGWLAPDFSEAPFTMWFFALSKVFGGLGPLGTSDTSESVLITVTNLGVRISFAILQGLIMRVLTTGNPDETRFRQRLDALNGMMRDQHIPKSVRYKVRDYFRKAKQLNKRLGYFGLIDSTVSTRLKTDLCTLMSRHTFDNIWWLKECEVPFIEELCKATSREAYAIDEPIPNSDAKGNLRLTILVNGVASRAGAILTTGASWGDIFITSPRLRDTRPAKALTFCELVVLGRDALEKLMPNFPVSEKVIRHAALQIATHRTLILVAMYAKLRENVKLPNQAGSPTLTGVPPVAHKQLGTHAASPARSTSLTGEEDQSPSGLLMELRSSPSTSPKKARSSQENRFEQRSGSLLSLAEASCCSAGLFASAAPPTAASPTAASPRPHRGEAAADSAHRGEAAADSAHAARASGAATADAVPNSVVMARLDRMEATMQLMLQKMTERDAREAASHAAWHGSGGGNRLAA